MKHIITRITIMTLLIFSLSGCTKMFMVYGGAKPSSLRMHHPPEGPEIYQQGFKEGCESGYSAYSNTFDKVFWTWKQDPKLAQNKVYYQIWKDAYSYCANYGMMSENHGWGNWR